MHTLTFCDDWKEQRIFIWSSTWPHDITVYIFHLFSSKKGFCDMNKLLSIQQLRNPPALWGILYCFSIICTLIFINPKGNLSANLKIIAWKFDCYPWFYSTSCVFKYSMIIIAKNIPYIMFSNRLSVVVPATNFHLQPVNLTLRKITVRLHSSFFTVIEWHYLRDKWIRIMLINYHFYHSKQKGVRHSRPSIEVQRGNNLQ